MQPRHLLSVRRWSESAEVDKHNNPVGGYGEPEPLPVLALEPGASREAVASGRVTDEVAWTLYCPAGTQVGGRDVVAIDGIDYPVNSDSLDWTRGPWENPAAGVVVELLRKRG